MTDAPAPARPLEGRVALITGAAGAIGSAAARLLAERGAHVVCVVRRPPEIALPGVVLPGVDLPEDALVLTADVTHESEVEAVVAETLARFARLDVFFNNAGVEGPQASIADCATADFERVLAVNVLGVFLGLKHVMPVMIDQGAGSIVNTGSIASLRGAARMAGYVASKHAVLGLTRTAALEGAPFGVRVNAVLPGFIESRMLSDIAGRLGADVDGLAERTPAGRLGQPEEVARAVAFLASDESLYMNGAHLLLDGALTAGL